MSVISQAVGQWGWMHTFHEVIVVQIDTCRLRVKRVNVSAVE